jgi:AcrR family transcriptional regulator
MRPYHHGNLRRELLDAALAQIRTSGVAAVSLRELARELDVSHAAPAHHFVDKAGLLTAIATEGFELLAVALRAHAEDGFLAVGLAYVAFAIDHPAHFEVMFRPDMFHADDPELVAAKNVTRELLYGPAAEVAHDGDTQLVGIAGWSFVHGFATLWATGNLTGRFGDDPIAAARAVGSVLFARPRAQGNEQERFGRPN